MCAKMRELPSRDPMFMFETVSTRSSCAPSSTSWWTRGWSGTGGLAFGVAVFFDLGFLEETPAEGGEAAHDTGGVEDALARAGAVRTIGPGALGATIGSGLGALVTPAGGAGQRGDHDLNPGMAVPEKTRPAAVLVPIATHDFGPTVR